MEKESLLSEHLRVKFARLNQKLTMPKLRMGAFLVYTSEFHSRTLRECPIPKLSDKNYVCDDGDLRIYLTQPRCVG